MAVPTETRARIDSLREQLTQHIYRYHQLDDPTVSDAEYDELMRELVELEQQYPDFASDDSPSRTVGGSAAL